MVLVGILGGWKRGAKTIQYHIARRAGNRSWKIRCIIEFTKKQCINSCWFGVFLTILYLVKVDCTHIHSHLKTAVQDQFIWSIYCNPSPGNGLSQVFEGHKDPCVGYLWNTWLVGVSFFLTSPAHQQSSAL